MTKKESRNLARPLVNGSYPRGMHLTRDQKQLGPSIGTHPSRMRPSIERKDTWGNPQSQNSETKREKKEDKELPLYNVARVPSSGKDKEYQTSR